MISAETIRAKAANKLQRGLSHLSAAPLKPQQRLYILKHHLMLALYHELVLTPCPEKYMNWLDRSIRAALRSWLKMPKDTPTAYFHAEIVDGGLRVNMLSQTMPLMSSKRLGRLEHSDDPVISPMLEYVAGHPGIQRHLQAKTYGDSIINTRETLHAALAGQLHRSVDGRGLTLSATVPDQHGWIQDPPNTTSGRSLVEAVLLRGSLLHTALRAGVTWTHPPGLSPVSRRAGREAQQGCAASSTKCKAEGLELSGTIPTRAGVRRPDIVLYKDTGRFVLSMPKWWPTMLTSPYPTTASVTTTSNLKSLLGFTTRRERNKSSIRAPRCRGVASCLARLHTVCIRWWGLSKDTLSLISQVTLEMG